MRRYIIIVISAFILLLLVASPMRKALAPFRYRELVKYYAEKNGLDWLLVSSIIYHESKFRYLAESKKGARGLMQIMPKTGFEIAKKMGLKDFSSDYLFRPRINIEIGCFYFNGLLREFNNDIRLALAAYNAGKGSVYRCYTLYKTDSIMPISGFSKDDLSYPSTKGGPLADTLINVLGYTDIQKYLYPETRCYVSRVNNTYRLLKLLDKVWRL